MEIVNPNIPRGPQRVRHALFDFDGTLSLIREGWRDVMIPLMVELLLQTPRHESETELHAVVAEFVDRLTGKQTIYQMIQLYEEIDKRGGSAADPLEYKTMYLARLWTHIEHRVTALKAGTVAPDDLMVPGAAAILQALRARGVACYLASGTDEPYVLDEAGALGITPYFAGIYGAQDDYKNFSKKMVVDRIIREHRLHGSEFVAFGDGYVEIEDAKAAGGLAVGVASNEDTRTGVNAWKRARLIQAGADIIIPDFREHAALVAYLFADS
ncbi:MAG: HAD family hydrolase [Chloroflexota bacterium]|nr:HAD family hydrolase [Chloroflexota bacterium]